MEIFVELVTSQFVGLINVADSYVDNVRSYINKK